jgi:hypothetical protein
LYKQTSEYEDTVNYHHRHCNEDYALFESWQAQHGYRLGHDGSTDYEPKVCLEYTEFMANYPISSDDLGIKPLEEDLYRT